MKLKFINKELCYLVKEDGKDSKKVTYETIGFITKEKPCLKIDEDFSGILEFDELEQIYNFTKKLKENKKLDNGRRR